MLYLAMQLAAREEVATRTLDELKHDLMGAADPRAWMQVHPWMTLASSAVAGFVATAAVVPSKEQQALNRLRKLEESLERAEHPERFPDEKSAAKAKAGGGGIRGLVYRVIQPMIVSTLTGFLSGKAAAPADATGGVEPGMEAMPAEAAVTADPGI